MTSFHLSELIIVLEARAKVTLKYIYKNQDTVWGQMNYFEELFELVKNVKRNLWERH